MPVLTRLQLRRGTAAAWTSANPTLSSGEPGFETDTGLFKIGDGSTAWTSLDYFAGAVPGVAIADVTGLTAALAAKLDDSQATAFGLSLLDDADATAGRSTLGLGTAATQASGAFDAAGAASAAQAASQPVDATLTALAGLNATAGLVEQTGADTFTKRALGVAAGTDVLTRADGDGRYSLGAHTHSGLAPSGGAINFVLKKNSATDYDFSWQADATSGGSAWGGITGTLSAQTDLQTALDAKQPLDADLTAIAALTTTAFGRGLLTSADATGLRDTAGVVIGTDVAAQSHVGAGGAAHATAVAAGAAGFMTGTDKTKLDGIATGATANSSDATLLARGNHTGTQTASTISDFNTAADARVTAGITGKQNLDATLTALAGLDATAGLVEQTGADTFAKRALGVAASTSVLTRADGDARFQPLDSDLTAIAALTTTAFGRGLLSLADAAALTASINAFTSALPGTTPASGGGTTNFLRADGTWAAPGGGGGGSPGGNANELQYNDGAGGFAGAANVEVDTGNLKLVSTTDPTAPTGGLLLYSKSIAGRHLPKIIGPSGIDTVLQVGLSGNSVLMIAPNSGTTAPSAWGGTLTTAATMSAQQTIASANPWLATWRKRFQTSTTAGNASGMRTAYVQWFRGNAAGFGGFFFRAQVGANINLNGGQKFCGLCASTGALAGEPSALLNMIGMGWDAADSSAGNWQLMRNDGSGVATKVDLGANALRSNTTHGYDLIIYCPPGAATEIFVRVMNLHSNVVVLDTSYTTDLPAVNVGMAFKCEVRNGAVASADNIECAKVYIESDY